MRAVVLAGGQGMRLRPYTTILPKALVPVGDRPVVDHILDRLERFGVERVDLCVNYLGEVIQAYLMQTRARRSGMEIVFHWEDEPLGTAGALSLVDDLEGTFLVMNGDVLTALDLHALWTHHAEDEADLTIAVHRRRVDVPLGVLDLDGDAVTGYREKPSLQYDASMGVYVYDAAALECLPAGVCQFPDLVLRLLAAGRRVSAHRSDAPWHDIGTIETHEIAALDLTAHAEPL